MIVMDMEFAKKIKNYLIRLLFPFFEKYLGVHILPVHYFSPIPNVHKLKGEAYSKPYSCIGIDWNESQQIAMLNSLVAHNCEFVPVENTGLSLLDAAILYSMIRDKKPQLMIEIGSGESTKIALQALKKTVMKATVLNSSRSNHFHLRTCKK